MRKILLVLCLAFLFITVKFQEVDAGIVRYDIYSVTLPRFAYVNYYDIGSDEVRVNDSIHFHIKDINHESLDVEMVGNAVMYQVFYNGEYYQYLDSQEFTLEPDTLGAYVDLNFSDIKFDYYGLAYYSIEIDGTSYYSGVLSNNNPDLTNYYDMEIMSEFEVSRDNTPFQLIHYRFPEDILDVGNNVNIRNFNIYSGLIDWSITSTSITTAQIADSVEVEEFFTASSPTPSSEIFSLDYEIVSVEDVLVNDVSLDSSHYVVGVDSITILGGYCGAGDDIEVIYYHENEQIKNGFIMITLDGSIPPFLDVDYTDLGDTYSNLLNETDYGCYLLSIANTSGTYLAYDNQVWTYTSQNKDLFELIINPNQLMLTDDVYVNFRMNDDNAKSVYSTIYINDDYYTDWTPSDIPHNSITVSYPVSSSLEVGDFSIVDWWVYPDDVAIIGATPSNYKIELSSRYDIVENGDSLAPIGNLFSFIGIDVDLLGIFVSMLFFIGTNIIMAFVKNGMLTLISNAMVLIILVMLGFSPIWLTLGVGLILVLGLLLMLASGGGVDYD